MGRKLKLDIRKAHTKKAKLAKKFKLDIRKGCRGSVEDCCPPHVLSWSARLAMGG